jgi:hypothetical protein
MTGQRVCWWLRSSFTPSTLSEHDGDDLRARRSAARQRWHTCRADIEAVSDERVAEDGPTVWLSARRRGYRYFSTNPTCASVWIKVRNPAPSPRAQRSGNRTS